jgi:SET domain-containing protein
MKYVGVSKIQGNGLFTSSPIPKGSVIVDYRYIKNWYKISVNNLTEYQINHNWIIMVDKEICETTDLIYDLNYMNQSRTPNADWHIKEKYITSARDIEAGEELTIDYRLEARSNRVSFS